MSLWRCICPCMPLYSSNGIVGYMMGYIGYIGYIGYMDVIERLERGVACVYGVACMTV